MNTPIPAIKIEKRQKLIEQGKLWQVYPEGDSDNILFEGSRTACMKYIRQNCPNAWRKNEVRLGKVIREAPEPAALNPADITPAFNYQRIDPEDNLPDLEKWVKEDKMEALIDEEMGGIIGYINQDHIDRITAILNTSKG